ncbi:hypothetical protein HA402_006711 [Bradysia odoriphaga]|nr:hypothetical protein HA402_006711 [Bradysia odoriphaga]
MNLLAQPKVVMKREVPQPYVVRRKVPGPSPRIIQLARPKSRLTLETCNRFGATMDQFCIENCHRNVRDVTFVPVHDAVYFIELNKRKPLVEKEKLKLRMKRLQEKINEAKMAKTKDILRTLYSSLKRYLMPLSLLPEKKPAECAECAKGVCAGCIKIENSSDDGGTDQQAGGIVDDETKKLSLVLRRKMEKLLNHEKKIEQGSHWDLLLELVSKKLAIWAKKLQNSEVIVNEPEATADSATDANVTK